MLLKKYEDGCFLGDRFGDGGGKHPSVTSVNFYQFTLSYICHIFRYIKMPSAPECDKQCTLKQYYLSHSQ